jgi:TonB family protein
MRIAATSLSSFSSRRVLMFLAVGAFMFAFAGSLRAQNPQLTLADLLIGLRSKKVTLEERNRILAEAVRQRGITFSLTGEIEKELSTTGAGKELITAIKQKETPPKKAEDEAKPTPVVAATPAPPDFTYYKSRADVAALKGDYVGALADYTKSLELKSDNGVVLFSRGQTYFNLKSYDLSVADFNKAIELNPKDSMAYTNRAMSNEKLNDTKQAMADYQKAVDLDAANETAKASLKRLQQDEQAKLAAKSQPVMPAPVPVKVPEPVRVPEFLNIGNISTANAVKMVGPIYPQFAQKAQVEGRVTVEVMLDEEGQVIEAKATTGPQVLRSSAEDAAARSKFKPAMFDGKPIKAKGLIIYNFSLKPTR